MFPPFADSISELSDNSQIIADDFMAGKRNCQTINISEILTFFDLFDKIEYSGEAGFPKSVCAFDLCSPLFDPPDPAVTKLESSTANAG